MGAGIALLLVACSKSAHHPFSTADEKKDASVASPIKFIDAHRSLPNMSYSFLLQKDGIPKNPISDIADLPHSSDLKIKSGTNGTPLPNPTSFHTIYMNGSTNPLAITGRVSPSGFLRLFVLTNANDNGYSASRIIFTTAKNLNSSLNGSQFNGFFDYKAFAQSDFLYNGRGVTTVPSENRGLIEPQPFVVGYNKSSEVSKPRGTPNDDYSYNGYVRSFNLSAENVIYTWQPGAYANSRIAENVWFGNAAGITYTGLNANGDPIFYIADERYNSIVDMVWSGPTVQSNLLVGSRDQLALTSNDLRHVKYPCAVGIDADKNIYICDRGNHRIIRFAPSSRPTQTDGQDQDGVVVAGEGLSGDQALINPTGLQVFADGSFIVVDNGAHIVYFYVRSGVDEQGRAVYVKYYVDGDPNGTAGDGASQLNEPYGVFATLSNDSKAIFFFISDYKNNRVVFVNVENGTN